MAVAVRSGELRPVVRDRVEQFGREGEGAHPGCGLRRLVGKPAVLQLGLSLADGDGQPLQPDCPVPLNLSRSQPTSTEGAAESTSENKSRRCTALADHALMPLTDTLARVNADLAAGRVPMARQRLRGLVSSFPNDLPLRRRLAEVYRLYGESAEAGRWMYLEEDRDADETAAFEARYHTPQQRMRALAWRGPESIAPSAFAMEQLAAVRTACSDALGRPVDWDTVPSVPDDEPDAGNRTFTEFLAGAGCLVAALVMLGIWVNGLIALFD